MNDKNESKKKGNPLWIPGVSGNPEGARRKMKHSARTLSGKVERVMLGYFSGKVYKEDFYSVSAKDRLQHAEKMAAIILPRAQADGITADQVAQAIEIMKQEVLNAEQKKIG